MNHQRIMHHLASMLTAGFVTVSSSYRLWPDKFLQATVNIEEGNHLIQVRHKATLMANDFEFGWSTYDAGELYSAETREKLLSQERSDAN